MLWHHNAQLLSLFVTDDQIITKLCDFIAKSKLENLVRLRYPREMLNEI